MNGNITASTVSRTIRESGACIPVARNTGLRGVTVGKSWCTAEVHICINHPLASQRGRASEAVAEALVGAGYTVQSSARLPGQGDDGAQHLYVTREA